MAFAFSSRMCALKKDRRESEAKRCHRQEANEPIGVVRVFFLLRTVIRFPPPLLLLFVPKVCDVSSHCLVD